LRGLLSWGSGSLQRMRQQEATCIGFTWPDCAASPGFLSLLTLSFLPEPSRLCFTPQTLLGLHPSEVFPPDPPGKPLGSPAPLDVPCRGPLNRPPVLPLYPCLCPVRVSVPRNGPQRTGSRASRKVSRHLIMPSQFFPHAPVQLVLPLKNAPGKSLVGRLRGATPREALHEVKTLLLPQKRSPGSALLKCRPKKEVPKNRHLGDTSRTGSEEKAPWMRPLVVPPRRSPLGRHP
jgi:hypothetical protein